MLISFCRVFFLILVFIACSEKNTIPTTVEVTNDLKISSFDSDISVFVQQSKHVTIDILSKDINLTGINYEIYRFDNFLITGPHIKDSIGTLAYDIAGINVMDHPESVTIPLIIEDKSCDLEFNVFVPDFYLATSFKTNLDNDTLVLERGHTFVLYIACMDSDNKLVPRDSISKMIGLGYYFWQDDFRKNKFVISTTQREPLYFTFVFAVYDDIYPTETDKFQEFTFLLSNKKLRLPIRINY